ncbi:hypothetical protein [Methylobacter sp.]|uniref:hypothetical protein n=1 Tax=Methylobacter sp. TaxID=2051955 RepID=UPI003DA6185C
MARREWAVTESHSGQSIDDTIGTALGYQRFLGGIDSQLIFEVGARTSTKSEKEEGAVGFGARFSALSPCVRIVVLSR